MSPKSGDSTGAEPPIEPMLAKLADTLPPQGSFLYEPKWDGFRSIVFRSESDVYIQSRDLRPFDRYFPELHDSLLKELPPGCVLDGEIVIMTPQGLDFDLLQLRLHPAASRVAKLAKETPASFVAFDLLAVDGKSLLDVPQQERRRQLERLAAKKRVARFGRRPAAQRAAVAEAAEHELHALRGIDQLDVVLLGLPRRGVRPNGDRRDRDRARRVAAGGDGRRSCERNRHLLTLEAVLLRDVVGNLLDPRAGATARLPR
ncbi:MAG TPA: hypothetical protein VN609_04775 [Propionibacteriaceae bacterium]|nr:hypothetical protein [Propionibacteriaceae bacterium]